MVDINGQSVQPSNCVKFMGVHVDDELRFQNHLYVICSRASGQINALNSVSKFLSKDCKVKSYNAFILSNFLYCFIVWQSWDVSRLTRYAVMWSLKYLRQMGDKQRFC